MGKSYFFFPRWKLVFISTYKLHVLLLSKILHSVFDCIVGLYHGLCCLLCSVFCAVVLYCAVHGRMLDFSLEWTQITNVRQNALRRCFTTFYVYYFFIVCALVVLCAAANVDYFHMLFGWQSLRLFIFIVKWNYVIKSCVLLFVLRSKHMKRETNYLQHFPFYVIIGVIA